MRNFLKIAENVDVTPVLLALTINDDLWDENTLRTQHPGTAHANVNDIWLMFNDATGEVVNDTQVKPYRAWDTLKPLRALILDLMHRVNGVQLGRCIVTKLSVGNTIAPHVDSGAPATFYTRYQIVLQSLPGALFHIGEETVNFRTGDIWLINNREKHSVVNNSSDDRIVCIVDIRSA
jgi:hypothetical protein